MRISEFELISEIKEKYFSLRRSENDRTTAVEKLTVDYQQELTAGAEDDGCLFWLGVADAQYAFKELSEEVAKKGLHAIAELCHIDMEICVKDLLRRKQNYEKAPMPERKITKGRSKYCCTWKLGDTFAYQIKGEDANKLGINGCYALIRKVNESKRYDGSIVPIVTISICPSLPLPSTCEEFQGIPLLKLATGRLDTPKGNYEYRTEVIIKSQKQIKNANLEYIGNFKNVQLPLDEHIIIESGCILMTLLDRIDEDICRYLRRNEIILKIVKGHKKRLQ